MGLPEKRARLIRELSAIADPQERLRFVVARGRSSQLDDSLKTDAHRVEGCLSRLWFVPEYKEGLCFFRSDSDSSIVRGIASILCEFYSGEKPEEILAADPAFLVQVGITQHLSANRTNALSRLWSEIRQFAEKHLPSNRLS